ncbi:uncharacterized protein LOC106702426 [Latimeria chalumnae]|uniref:uncharacterized protein LOC106702426 n=1 Tax=Latimeria chalumnae TaxID=7897 RepID=UPI0006D92A9E|nr:PREDICTED: uncharacterized protein LOC106702426 [Latimeria chalumnae]|eukprot:XP_014340164.1 PREDICTED: uncharacterized protein LOC106702426 [Latimeria chalumnae]
MHNQQLHAVPRIIEGDRCSPHHLTNNKTSCLIKIVKCLQYYDEFLKLNTDSDSSTVRELIIELKGLIEAGLNIKQDGFVCCLPLWQREHHRPTIVEKIKSFSALVARVFTPGDPAMHSLK